MLKQPDFLEIEVNTFCNRSCLWCPNSISSRGKINRPMSRQVWDSILKDLEAHSYQGWLAFHNYNEPLASPAIYMLIDEARERLKTAKLAIYTNGDYLKGPALNHLLISGINEIRITIYPNHLYLTYEERLRDVHAFARLNLRNVSLQLVPREDRLQFEASIQSTKLVLISPDISSYSNRGGLLGCQTNYHRSKPCHLPRMSAAIDVNGNVKLCCQIYDVTAQGFHKYILGNVTQASFLEIWNSPEFNRIRQKLLSADYDGLDACQKCDHFPTL